MDAREELAALRRLAELEAKASGQTYQPAQAPQEERSGMIDDIMQGAGDLAAGAIRGAGSIGATILSPLDFAARKLNNGKPVSVGGYDVLGIDRRTGMDQGLRSMGANPDSLAFQGGKLATEIAGTAGAGGALAKAVGAVPGAAKLAAALRSGGAVGPNLATRMAGGAMTGGAASALINPEEAGTGAMIGGTLPLAGPVMSALGKGTKVMLGGTTGVGEEAITQALRAGKQGGKAGAQFTANLRGQAPMDEVLSMAKQNLQAMGQQRQQAYRSGMANIRADKSVLTFDGVDDAIKNAMSIGTFKGKPVNDRAFQAVSEAADEVSKWKALDPAEFHTPEGLDALKQRIGSLLEGLDPVKEGQARKAVGGIYDSIKTEIGKQAPEYSKVMKGYSEASDLLREIEGSLSLGSKARNETAMRKLQSLMRNNVNTSYGYRDELAGALRNAGGQDVMPALAGQAMSDWVPRGIQRATASGGGAGLALTGNIPAAAGLAAVSSPRLVGEGAYLAGRASGSINPKLLEALRRGAYSSAPIVGTQE